MWAMLIVAGVIVAAAAVVQGAVGFGLSLVAAPLLVLLDPALVPVPLIILASMHAVLTVIRDGRHADWRGVGWVLLGRVPGTGLGVLAVATLPQRGFGLVVGLCVLAFVVVSLLRWRPRLRPRALLLAGVASGAGGTAVAIGGPPLALLYQHSTGPRVRATLAAVFVAGSAISLGALAIAGEVTTESLRDAALLLPFLIIGFLLSGLARRILDQGWTRTAVLTVASASAVLLVLHSAVDW
ncbi:MAG: TSUP family transporter [Pseudonocardiaceae bacterium]|nr:TSUP family transporter [Pseudonocardiaceae bacterium]